MVECQQVCSVKMSVRIRELLRPRYGGRWLSRMMRRYGSGQPRVQAPACRARGLAGVVQSLVRSSLLLLTTRTSGSLLDV